ncbi:CHAP domain-containing protein [Sphingobacterium tabacisoli]|uniref:CHAP domain-containing protein n=1 Tax=Sphingobacterium tabacisoli TaxID=2044855 RepID=A0ABW5L499_9SPHI|nr:CHAP domain-containing protein [Sphingobacterium tabacisoli]
MATMHSIFLSFLLHALCSGKSDGDSVVASATRTTVQSLNLSSLKQFPIRDDLLAYGIKGRKATNSNSVHFAIHKDFQSMGRTLGKETLETASVALRSRDKHRVNSLDLCGTFYQGKVPRHSANKEKRNLIITIATRTPVQLLNLSPSKFLTIAVGCASFLSKVFSDEFLRTFCGKKYEPHHGLSGIRAKHSVNNDKRNLIIAIATRTPVQSLNLSPSKFLTIAVGCTSFLSKVFSDEFLRTFCGKKYEPRHGSSGIRAKHSPNNDKRNLIITIASAELGIKEATGNNDGPRVEQYLRYTNLGPGYDWCAAFVSWVYGQAGFSAPRNPWSPALFPKARTVKESQVQPADLFAIYSTTARRIHHVGLIRSKQEQYILTIEGNSNNRVESRRRHVKTVYSYAGWIK